MAKIGNLLDMGKETESTQKKGGFLAGFFHIGLGTAINMIIGFFTTPIITRIVDPAEYGRLAIFNMYISIAIMILCFGLDQALVRYYYKEDSNDYKRWLVSSCSIIPLIISVAFVFFFSIVVKLLGLRFEFEDSLLLLSFGIVGHLLYRFGTLVLRLDNKNKLYSAVYVANKVIYITLALGLVLLTDWNRFYCLGCATVFSFFSTAVFAVLRSREKWKLVFSNSCGGVTRRELLKYGLPFIVSMGLTTLFQSIDKMSLNYFCDYATVGIYTSAMTIISVFAIIQTTFNTMWAPMMVKHYESNPEDRNFYTRYNSLITVTMFSFGLTLILFKDIFGLLLGAKYRDAAYIVPFLAIEPIMLTISETTVTGIVVKNKSYMNIIVAGVACVTNIIGNSVLVPFVGPKGAAISTGLSYIVFFIMRTVIGSKYYKVNYNLGKFAVITVFLIGFAVVNTFSRFGIWTIASYLTCIGCLVVLYRDSVGILLKTGREVALKVLRG